eukprot:SAG22_NODE_3631_length_1605_cov_1.223772_2_plen_99_part_00
MWFRCHRLGVSKNFTGMTMLVMTPHCHAPSCLSQEMWTTKVSACKALSFCRASTVFLSKIVPFLVACLSSWTKPTGEKDELICRSVARYGTGACCRCT